jgi:hypothetical protein
MIISLRRKLCDLQISGACLAHTPQALDIHILLKFISTNMTASLSCILKTYALSTRKIHRYFTGHA